MEHAPGLSLSCWTWFSVSDPMTSSDRFFPAAILGGRMHVRGIPDWGPWDPTRLEWHTEGEIDPGLVPAAGDRKVRTPAELEAIMQAPARPTPTQFVWVHESLVDEVRQLWKQMAAELR